jgi:hypothetical protein
MKKAAGFFWLVTWMFLQSTGQAQAGPEATKLANNETPSSPLASLPVQPATAAGPLRSVPSQKFVCGPNLTLEKCKPEMAVLAKKLANYRASDLGEWKWVLVPSENWKLILLARGLNLGIPALTALDARTTFFEEALISGPSGRVSELMDIWHVDRDSLLDLAVRHELGHALCTEENELRAERVARLLEQKKPVVCQSKTGAGQKSSN